MRLAIDDAIEEDAAELPQRVAAEGASPRLDHPRWSLADTPKDSTLEQEERPIRLHEL